MGVFDILFLTQSNQSAIWQTKALDSFIQCFTPHSKKVHVIRVNHICSRKVKIELPNFVLLNALTASAATSHL